MCFHTEAEKKYNIIISKKLIVKEFIIPYFMAELYSKNNTGRWNHCIIHLIGGKKEE